MKGKLTLVVLFIIGHVVFAQAQQVTTYAGQPGVDGFDFQSTPASQVRLNEPHGIGVDASGKVYITDNLNNAIKIVLNDSNVITRGGQGPQANGFADGHTTNSMFSGPEGIVVGADGSIYVADTWNHIIRKITPFVSTGQSMTVSTIGGTPQSAGYANGMASQFEMPSGIAVDGNGNVYVSEPNSHIIRKIAQNGSVSLFAGIYGERGGVDGSRTSATFNRPGAMFIKGNEMYVAEQHGRRIRKIELNGNVSTVLDSSANFRIEGYVNDPDPAKRPGLFMPRGIVVAPNGDIYIADNMVIKLLRNDSLTVFVGLIDEQGITNGYGKDARFSAPFSLAISGDGTKLYTADVYNHTIRQIELGTDTTNQPVSVAQIINPQTINIFPVPASTMLNLEFENENLKEIFVFDMQGKRVKSAETRDKQFSFSISSLKNGNYVVAIAENGRFVKRQIVIVD